ncbi:hypothetical protein CsSME_00047795 [Camellia sinensis var. sinensis]|uniref:uncharacterized protein LOC114266415 isoform X1 n=1 Tax=Camellia sinensis TaxID=4442 RepID=UPI0010365927|nr:uncharacterized protein LOC114266415 isoform X1 [Camellia sinensis]
MDELEFQRILNLFPVVRPRDYHADSESSTRQSTVQPPPNEERKEWQDAWDGSDEKEIAIQEIEHDSFWAKLKMAAEKKVGAAKAEQFCKAFRTIHKKLVYEEMSLDAARSFLSSPKNYGE